MGSRVLRVAACLAVWLAGTAIQASANAIIIQIDLPKLGGSDLRIDSFSFGLTGKYETKGGERHVKSPSASDFSIERAVDTFSATLALGCADGTVIPAGDIKFFKPSYSPTNPYLEFQFTDGTISSYQVLGGGGGGIPEEAFTITFEKLTAKYAADPQNPFAALLPYSSQVQDGAFALNFGFDVATDDSIFHDSDIVMDATIPGQVPTPEPGSILLLGSGLMGIAGVVSRKLA